MMLIFHAPVTICFQEKSIYVSFYLSMQNCIRLDE
ncbi:hypothetical protein MUK42_37298 [Musa troglodytarum]|uniref:Uncharacterized protein n=1 Tax=Musa troglodytarum TaxID=320322 RepID=A0A9E7ECW7_9LILI|nr:hypothetical protein MUK42_37298 [Musa troglodytarum]